MAEIMDVVDLLPPDEYQPMDGAETGSLLDAVQGIVTRSIEEARAHFEENIEPDMAEATDYYYGRAIGDLKGETGRSKVISTDVRDATLDQIPDLLEIFMGSDSVVEFKPDSPEKREQAEQATDMVNYIFYEDNPGFLILNSVLKDAGVRRLAYVKWQWQENSRVKGQSMTGLTQDEVMFLQAQNIDYEIVGERMDEIQTPEGPMPITTYDCEIRYKDEGRVVIEAVPPEEVYWTPEARAFDKAPLVVHHRQLPVDEVLQMGYTMEDIETHLGVLADDNSTESLKWARQIYGGVDGTPTMDDDALTLDPSQRPVLFAEAYALVDTDGDGIGELRMFHCIGPSYHILNGNGFGELVDEVPLAVFTPDPEPHTIPGLSNFDHLKEIQKVKSQIQRGQLNSLAQSIENQMVVAQSEVNVRDLISPEISGLIRVRRDVNAIREIKHQFVGGDTLPVLEYYDQIRADRTGRAGPREGLNANILQSTDKDAVQNTISKSQQRIRMVARVYAETGFKSLFRGIYRLLVENQRRKRYVKLRGKYVMVDPRSWDSDMDVSVSVGLGGGSVAQKLQNLMLQAEKQEMHLQLGSPLVSFSELRTTYGKMADLMGYKDTDQFWRPWDTQQQQMYEQQQAQAAENAEKEPAQRVVDVEETKVQMDAIQSQKELELKELDIRLKDEREREKMAREFALRESEMELKYSVELEKIDVKASVPEA